MKQTVFRLLSLSLALLLCLPLLVGVSAVGTLTVTAEASDYVEPAYVVDFTDPDNVMSCKGAHALTVESGDDGLVIRFADTEEGLSVDPYLTFPLPENGISLAQYHYFAMLVKTDKHDKRGELRFKSTTTGDDYPCQFFNYAETDDWQLIVLDLTDRSTVNYCGAATPLEGALTRVRLDMFNNTCDAAETSYAVKAYGLYETREAAETFIHFTPSGGDAGAGLPDVDYTAFWRGEAFAEPPLSARMRWLTYGFDSTSTAPIDSILARGYGGVVSNVLFEKDYLQNDRQFEIVAGVYEYAHRQGMSTWIYDEYQWPSGKAFGLVLEGHDEYEATGVAHRFIQGSGGEAAYACTDKEIRILRADLTDADGTRTLGEADGLAERSVRVNAKGAWTLHVYVQRYTYEGTEDRNDFTTLRPVDLLNKDAVARFIEVTYDRYKEKMGESFSLVEAFFTDEPQLGNRARTGYVVWTPGMEELFRAEYGYELDLAALFDGTDPDAKRCRMHYFSLVAKLFREAYTEQIADWCEKNGTASSGHLLFEECMTDQVETYGGDYMQIVGAMTIPGVDLLWVDPGHLLSKNHIGNHVGIRYTVSAAKNAGKDRVMVEFNPNAANALSETDPLSDCIAGTSLTRLLGTTDYNVINPQYNLAASGYRALNIYAGRLNTLLEGAVECGDVAVFYPIATVQALCNADDGHTTETNNRSKAFVLDTRFQNICTRLLQAGYLYTVLDDKAIREATVASDGCLCIGDGAYTTVILPMAQYMSADALETLATFRRAGGTVIFVGDRPAYGLRAEEDARVAAVMATMADAPAYQTSDEALYTDLAAYAHRAMTVKGAEGTALLSGDFAVDGREITYLCNTLATPADCVASYTDGFDGQVTVYYPGSGRIETATGSELTLTVPGNEAVLVVRESTAHVDHLAAHTDYVEEEMPPETLPAESETESDPASETLPDTEEPTPESDSVPTESEPTQSEPTASGDEPDAGCASALLTGAVWLSVGGLAAAILCRRRE